MAEIYPSLLNRSLIELKTDVAMLDSYVPGYHIDVMDGIFVPNLTPGVAEVNTIASMSMRTGHWVHLMITNPQLYIQSFLLAPGAIMTFHFESECDVGDMIKLILENNWKPSIAISPKTAVEKIFPFLHLVHQVLVMSVEPGRSGQAFLTESIKKVELLAGYRATGKLSFRIAIDGGINANNIAKLAEKGVDDFAVSSAIFATKDAVEALKMLQERVR